MKYVFVCTGNACRSPFAECVLRKIAADIGFLDLETTSVGTLNWGSNPRDTMMSKIAKEKGYEMTGTTTYMSEEILNSADAILIMEKKQRDIVTRMLKYDNWNRISTFAEYCFGTDEDIPDPHYGTEDLYGSVCEVIIEGCSRIIDSWGLHIFQ